MSEIAILAFIVLVACTIKVFWHLAVDDDKPEKEDDEPWHLHLP